MKFKVMSNFLL